MNHPDHMKRRKAGKLAKARSDGKKAARDNKAYWDCPYEDLNMRRLWQEGFEVEKVNLRYERGGDNDNQKVVDDQPEARSEDVHQSANTKGA